MFDEAFNPKLMQKITSLIMRAHPNLRLVVSFKIQRDTRLVRDLFEDAGLTPALREHISIKKTCSKESSSCRIFQRNVHRVVETRETTSLEAKLDNYWKGDIYAKGLSYMELKQQEEEASVFEKQERKTKKRARESRTTKCIP